MKKYLVLLVSLIIVSFQSIAENVNAERGKKIAINAYYEITFERNELHANKLIISNAYSYEKNNKAYYHVYNFENAGYIIIAADDIIRPVLAYSYKNSCPEENISPEFAWWMQHYVNKIDYLRENEVLVNPEVANEWDRLSSIKNIIETKVFKGIEPMLFTQWDQGAFYNASCPDDTEGPDNHALTGCVATALGQLLCYFRHPERGTGEYSYTYENYGELSVNFAEQEYNYDLMAYKLFSYNDEVAKLLYHIGVSVDMHYGPFGSGMTNHKGAYTLYTYFDYADETRYYFRDSVEMKWVDTLINHLDRRIPLYYAGWSDYDFISGHAFICDGYADSTFFHFNWGWGGSFDGYFYLDNLSPGGNDFTLLHEMIANAVPKTNYPHYFSGQKVINAKEGMIDDGSGPIFPYKKDNYCEWLINPEDSMSGIELEFLSFETLAGDILTVYDGPTTSDPVLGAFSGNENPGVVSGNRSTMLITFETISDNTTDGFLFKFECIEPVYCLSANTISDLAGEITDGSESYEYLNNTNCIWTFDYDETVNIEISFTKLNTQPENDYIRFYDVSNSQLINTFSGDQLPVTFFTATDKLRVFFVTDEEVRNDGFTFNYSVTTSVKPISESPGVKVYPNPATNELYVEFNEKEFKEYSYVILTLKGERVISSKIGTSGKSVKVDTRYIKSGIYLLEIVGEGQIFREKVIVTN